MSTNNIFINGDDLNITVPNTVVSGDPLLVGQMAGVAKEAYTTNPTATPDGKVAVAFRGAAFLSVTAATVLSPLTGVAVKPGDKLYADGGTLDTTTNVTRGFTLDKNTGGTFFGFALDSIASGSTATIRVRLKVGA
jgi:predicted RecA/RadA family phage recombinase